MTPFAPPSDYARIQVVTSFEALVAVPFDAHCNAVCWQRTLSGDFDEVVRELAAGEGVTTVTDACLQSLRVGAAGRTAIDTLIADQQRLRIAGHSPVLDCIRGYERDDVGQIVATDVYSFHIDRATQATDTYLCSYTEPSSEGLRNERAMRRVDDPAVRSQLLLQFGGEDDEAFAAWLAECCFDLHYVPVGDAAAFSFGVGNLWRIAVDYPGCRVPACIHRAPATSDGASPRLLLIS